MPESNLPRQEKRIGVSALLRRGVGGALAGILHCLYADTPIRRYVSAAVAPFRATDRLQAEASLRENGVKNILPSYAGPDDPNREDSIPWEAQRLFYRVDEIHTRAEIINEKIKPDLVLCLHFNAEPWGAPAHPVLVSVNHLHLLINLANRLYECPVIFIEAYVMNSQQFFSRFQAGEYEGVRNFGGVMRQNIFEEYVQGTVEGIAAYFRATRGRR